MPKKKLEKKVTHVFLPLHQRLRLCFLKNWIYLLIGLNMIMFIWFMIPSNRSTLYRPGFMSLQTQDDLRLSKDCFLPYWRDTSFMLKRRCLSIEFADELFNLEDEVIRLKSCQAQESSSLWGSPNNFFFYLPINILPESNKKIISFSLYGTSDRYLRNIIRIIRRYKELLPGWIPRFWIGSDVPFLMINRLLHEDAEIIVVYQRQSEDVTVIHDPGFHGMFWRFFIADDDRVERYIVRDCDSMPIDREVEAINEWIKEDTIFHIMRDHPQHAIEILGGMWGGKVDTTIFSPSREYEIAYNSGFAKHDGKGVDQAFLKSYLWPIARHSMTCHTAYNWSFVDARGCKQFPGQRDGQTFVGAVIDF